MEMFGLLRQHGGRLLVLEGGSLHLDEGVRKACGETVGAWTGELVDWLATSWVVYGCYTMLCPHLTDIWQVIYTLLSQFD